MKSLVYLLGLAVVILGVYSFDTTRKHAQLEQSVYALHTTNISGASEKLATLNRTVSQSLLFNDEQALKRELDDIWRMSSDLRGEVAQLPIQEEVRTSWMRYLGKIGDTAKQAAGGESQDWHKQMTVVSQNLGALTDEWTVATTSFFEHNGDFSQWKANQQTAIGDSSFQHVSKQLTSYNETDFPLTASESDYEKKRDLEHLMGEKITKNQAVAQFQTVFPLIAESTLTVTKSKDDAPYPFYHIQFVRGARIGYADITENSGKILSFLMERPVRKEVRSHEEIVASAKKFMETAGYTDVTLTESRENHEAWHFVFTRVVDQALVYPDSIQVKVAKDNGEVLGMNAMEYIQHETLPNQAVVEPEWKTFFADTVSVEEIKEIYTDNDALQLRRCFEVIVRMKEKQGNTFRVVLDTETHDIIKVEQLH